MDKILQTKITTDVNFAKQIDDKLKKIRIGVPPERAPRIDIKARPSELGAVNDNTIIFIFNILLFLINISIISILFIFWSPN